MKRGLLIVLFLVLFSVFVIAVPSGCEPTNIPSYKQYVDVNVKRVWDSYSAQSSGVCAFPTGIMPKGGDCKFSNQLTEGGFSKYLCWYGDSAVAAPSRPSACEPTHLPSYKQYVDSKIKSVWDSYSAQTESVCAYHPPARPESGKCIYTVELFEGNQPMWLCWYGKKMVAGGAKAVPAVSSHVKKSLWERFKSFLGFGKIKFPISLSEGQKKFESEVISKSQLPKGWYAMMYPDVVPAETKIQDGHFNSMILGADAIFGWLEPFPDLMYGHPTFYMILFGDGKLEVYQGNANAIVGGEDIRKVGKRFGSGSPTGGVVGIDAVVPLGVLK